MQGTEWTRGAEFNSYVQSTYAVQECLPAGASSCLDSAINRSAYDFVYLSKTLRVSNCIPLEVHITFPYFLESMRMNEGFAAVYESEDVVIFGKQ